MTASRVLVTPLDDGTFLVKVEDPRGSTTHTVEVPEAMARELGWGQADQAELVRESFAFLLEREPPASILGRFSLEVIGRYFPEYPSHIRRHGDGTG